VLSATTEAHSSSRSLHIPASRWLGALQQARGYRCAADCDESQLLRRRVSASMAATIACNSCGVRIVVVAWDWISAANIFLTSSPVEAAQSYRGQRQQMAGRSGHQRHVYPGEVLQQSGQRQHADMLIAGLALRGSQQGSRDLLQCCGTQAHALWMSCGAGGVSHLDRVDGNVLAGMLRKRISL